MTTGKKKHHVLLVDDDPGMLQLLRIRLQAAGYTVETATSAAAALGCIAARRPDAVISDVRMDGMDGIALLHEVQRRAPGLPVLLITAHGTIPDAVHATQSGAFGFLTKPINRDELLDLLARAVRQNGAVAAPEDWHADVITRSPRMQDLLADVRRVGPSDASVLIRGESGTGKELIARALHRISPRRDGPFVALNCAALPETLMEAELFGYERGAFTGATREYPGLMAAADGGTLFLDEIGDMPLNLQAKLLRVLQERRVRRIGGVADAPVDIRVVSATHRDLETAIRTGSFREDLYYRLNVVTLHVPPLRERREDIPLLVNHTLNRIAARADGVRKVYAPEAMELLVGAEWPGNVRQLENVVEQTVALSPGPVISAALVRKALGSAAGRIPAFDEARDEFTRQYLVHLLQLTGGNVTHAARLAQRHRTDFYKLLHRYALDPKQFKPAR
ncbi:MAG TPA: sigma 54-interacting transcriptional regulator [Burkholderiales bacterium]